MKDEKLEVNTTAGTLIACKNTDPACPGISIMFQPAGYTDIIEMSLVTVIEDESLNTEDNERNVDAVIYTYGDCYSEDYTRKDIIRREDIMEALGNEELKTD